MYKDNENAVNRYGSEYEQQIISRQRTRAAMRRKRQQRQRRILLAVVIAVIIIIISIVCFALKPNSENSNILNGVWKYDEYTKYEFKENGIGCMCLDNLHYKYTYKIDNNKLMLDFEDEAVHDCTYIFALNENELTIKGEDGTVGGTYRLTKE